VVLSSATSDGVDDLDAVAVLEHAGAVLAAWNDVEIDLDGNPPICQVQQLERLAYRGIPWQLARFAVDKNTHECKPTITLRRLRLAFARYAGLLIHGKLTLGAEFGLVAV
jgi:hypothetical protein